MQKKETPETGPHAIYAIAGTDLNVGDHVYLLHSPDLTAYPILKKGPDVPAKAGLGSALYTVTKGSAAWFRLILEPAKEE